MPPHPNPEFPPLPDLRTAVLDLLRQIPAGRVTTYGALAHALGDDQSRSARWLGQFLNDHPHLPDCHCHRVVRANGEIGLFVVGDPAIKARLLQREGIDVSDTGRVKVNAPFTRFASARPLEELRTFQKSLGAQAREVPLSAPPRTLGGIDVAYQSGGMAIAAYVQLEATTLQVLHSEVLRVPVDFPYIPGYLTFRELPIMLELCQRVRSAGKLADVIFCDGNGRLHPWRAGIATCLGVLLDHPVIGVGKSLLCGKVTSAGTAPNPATGAPVVEQNETIGLVLNSSKSTKPLYISTGHRVILRDALSLAQSALRGHRLPEPTSLADRLTKQSKQAREDS
ncbi:endonuclease V [Planctomicrobium sp. SH664]|uniref:endonuclease V n=1 Tax=Planctomicrobium sp. SH664 TaxID=3448125 RepID=UPI003F5CA1BD